MSLGQTIRGLLLANAPLVALVESRVFPNEIPQESLLPAVVYTVVSDVPEPSFTGQTQTTLKTARVQIDCYARVSAGSLGAYAQVQAVAEAVELALGNMASADLGIALEASRDLYDNSTQYHRVSMDFYVWH